MDRYEILAGLQAGNTLVISRRDAPELPIVLDLEREELVTIVLVQQDEQSSCLKVRLKVN
jgi:hypothetical protein